MSKKKSVQAINLMLEGSPYLLPEDDEGEIAAASVVARMAKLNARVRKLGPRLEQHQAEIKGDFAVRHVYESNALEGLGPSLQETFNIISERGFRSIDEIIRDRTLRESFGSSSPSTVDDVESLHDAYEFAHDLACSQGPIREIDLRNLHALITQSESFAGEYKQVEVEIEGAAHKPAPSFEVPKMMQDLVNWLDRDELHPALAATVGHAWLTHIHPFQDGNGRTARMLANLLLARQHFPPLVIKSQADRGQYLEALARSDEGGDIMAFFDLVLKATHRGAYELENPQAAKQLLTSDMLGSEVTGYDIWCALLQSFEMNLSTALENLGLRMRAVGGIGPSDFELLKAKNPSGNGWLAKVVGPSTDLLVWIGFTSNEMLDSAGLDVRWPAIFFSERDPRTVAQHPYLPLTNSGRLDIDEIVLQPLPHPQVFTRRGLYVATPSSAGAADEVARAISELRH